MLVKRLTRDRSVVAVVGAGVVIAVIYLGMTLLIPSGESRAQRLLTAEPWYCDVFDPERQSVVARSVETFHRGGTLEGRTRLEDRHANRLLLEFSYQGRWQFDDPWLTEAISEYRYLHVDSAEFSSAELAAIEAEFAEPEVSRVHALTQGQLVYGANQSIYQCHRRPAADEVAAASA